MSQTRQPVHVFPKVALKLGIWGRVGLVLAIITAIASYVLYHNGMRYKIREKQHYVELSQQIKQLTRKQQQTSNENAALQQQVNTLKTQLEQVQAGLAPEQRQHWLIRQVSRYLQLAEQQLLLQADIPSAQILLDVADKLLADNPDNSLLALRQAIAADKLTLTTAQQLDKVGLSLRLDALKQQTKHTVAPHRQDVSQTGHIEANQASPQHPWEKGWQAFRQLLTIRHYDQPVRPLLTDAQRELLQQHIYLALSQAQLALWDNQPTRYQHSLQEIEQLLTDYQPLNPQYAAILAEAKALAAVNLQVTVPTLNHSQQVLSGLIAQATTTVIKPTPEPTAPSNTPTVKPAEPTAEAL